MKLNRSAFSVSTIRIPSHTATAKVMLTPQQSAAFIAQLEKRGWTPKGDLIYSPSEMLWFPFPEGWKDTLSDLRETIVRRLNGFQAEKGTAHLEEAHASKLIADHESAIEAIDATLTNP